MLARLLTTTLVILAAPLAARAQPLADRVPPDALIYVGWRGTTSLGPGYEGSHLQAILQSSDIPKFFDEFLPQLMERVGQESPEAAGATAVFGQIGRAVWKYPTTLFVGPVKIEGGQPAPQAGLLIQAGNEAEALHKHIEAIVQPNVPFPIVTFNANGLVGVIVGYKQDAFEAAKPGASIQGAAGFKAAMAQVGKDPVLAAYVDVAGIRKLAEQFIQQGGDEQAKQMWPKVRDALGLQGLQQVAFTAGFRDKGWETSAFVAAPPPRRGLLALLDAKPVSEDALKIIPRSSRMAMAASFDIGRLFTEVRNVAGQLDPNARQMFDEGLKEASQQIGIDIERDFVGALGNEWVSYTSPTVGGNGLLGFVVVNRLRDPAKAQQTLVKLTDVINDALQEATEGEEVTVKLYRIQAGGMEVTYLAVPIVSPAWTVQNGNLYVALYPQNVVAAAKSAEGGSILENPAFATMRKYLGGANAANLSSIQFMDLPKSAPDAYPMWLAVSRVSGFADLFGVQSPPMLMPPLGVLMQHVTPAGAATWSDQAGWHYRSFQPFPAATLFANDPLTTYATTVGPTAIGVMLPALNKAREQANRVKSASNLRQIGLGAMMYANDNRGRFPKDFEELLLKVEDIQPQVFINPRGASDPIPLGDDRKAQIAAAVERGDYVWVGAGLTNAADAETIIAYENPERAREGLNVLFADGRVEWLDLGAALERIEARKQKRQ